LFQPLITCVMPTYGRPDYVCESLAMFLDQDYGNKDLLILNDCPEQTLICEYSNVHVINAPFHYSNLGDKRNSAIEQARGEFIAVWDDDDVYLPWRLSYSVTQLYEKATRFYFPAEFWAYWGDEPLHDNQAIPGWISHPMHIFEKSLWREAGGYPAQTVGEDTILAWKMLTLLGQDWPSYAISRFDRFLVMRGRSKYQHTSIAGGSYPPDTNPGTILLEPRRIVDPRLRAISEELVRCHESQ
jgi:glycosyltransferase involved in cell wall biosynthesis